jgi:hypothetical protein
LEYFFSKSSLLKNEIGLSGLDEEVVVRKPAEKKKEIF